MNRNLFRKKNQSSTQVVSFSQLINTSLPFYLYHTVYMKIKLSVYFTYKYHTGRGIAGPIRIGLQPLEVLINVSCS